MKAELCRQCNYCRSKITLEKASEIDDVVVDGRRRLSYICMVCGEKNELMSKMVPWEERQKAKASG